MSSSGADHSARFMAYSMYFLKMQLLSEQFEMTDEEKTGVKRNGNFYRAFLQCSIS